MVLTGYARRTGPTTASNPGILGLLRDPKTAQLVNDADGVPYTMLAFGNGSNRVTGARQQLSEEQTGAKDYHQEAAIRMPAGGETHGGTDVSIMAAGAGASLFAGFHDNVEVFDKLLTITRLPAEKR